MLKNSWKMVYSFSNMEVENGLLGDSRHSPLGPIFNFHDYRRNDSRPKSTLPEINSSHLEIGGWKTILSVLGWLNF